MGAKRERHRRSGDEAYVRPIAYWQIEFHHMSVLAQRGEKC